MCMPEPTFSSDIYSFFKCKHYFCIQICKHISFIWFHYCYYYYCYYEPYIYTHNIFKRKWRLELFFWHSLFCFLRCKKNYCCNRFVVLLLWLFFVVFFLNEKLFNSFFDHLLFVCVCYLGYNISLVVLN